jgi:uncharacterized protein (DUF2235 family)
MSKRIVLFSDGTGNSSAKAAKTNVWRMFQALNQTGNAQIAKYDDGVGTSSNKYLAAIGGVFGWGLKRNVIDLYKFVCRNYKASDEIYGFGFSRGSFTIRVLVGLIVDQGLVGHRSEAELSHNALAAYRRFRAEEFKSRNPVVPLLRWVRDSVIAFANWIRGYDPGAAAPNRAPPNSVPIKFLGLWDTVEAYGMPIAELKRGIDRWIWPMVFDDKSLSPLVERACHALSLDDERTTFHPILWNEVAEAKMIAAAAENPTAPRVKPGRLTQIWFAGVHSNLGGGYYEDQLSLVSLEWMMHEAAESGLQLDPGAIQQVSETKSPYARIYDSRQGFGAFYRYEPRRTSDQTDAADEGILPIVDSSVILRMACGSDHYAPITLPSRFWVMAPDGSLLPMHGPGGRPELDNTKAAVASPAVAKRKPPAQIKKELDKLTAAMKALVESDDEAIRLVWDTVWWRRLSYFLTMVLATILVSYPWLGVQYARVISGAFSLVGLGGLYGGLADVKNGTGGLIASVVDVLGWLIPTYLSSWTRTLIDDPFEFGATAIALVLCLLTSRTLQSGIHDRARLAWRSTLRPDYLKWRYDRNKGAQRTASVFLAIATIALLVAWYEKWGPRISLEIGIVAVFFGLIVLSESVSRYRLARAVTMSLKDQKHITSSFPLRFARRLRDNAPLVAVGRFFVWELVPALFALAVIVVAVALANRMGFDVANSMGAFCKKHGDEKVGAPTEFHTDDMCWRSGLVLQQGHRYRITLDASRGDWFDKSIRTDVAGFTLDSLRHFSTTPFKRWWGEKWFQPIARIGSLGNDEYVLTSVEPFSETPASYSTCQTRADLGSEAIPAKISDTAADDLMKCATVPADRQKVVTQITARTSGELFIYVNDAVLLLPKMSDYFYGNNRGTATVSVEHVDDRGLPLN